MNNYYIVEVSGKNINRFLDKLFKSKINIYDICYFKDRIRLKISYDDYLKLKDIKTIYSVTIIKVLGKRKYSLLFNKYKIFILFFLLSFFCIYMLSKFVFFININTDNKSIYEVIASSLRDNNITVYTYKKSFSYFNQLALSLREKYKDRIEWIEFSLNGVTLDVNVVLKEYYDNKPSTDYKDIVASDSGYIMDMYIESGEIVKVKGDYVNKGDIIVSGAIRRNDNIVSYTHAKGDVYAEVWKRVLISLPFEYEKEESDDSYTTYIDFKIFDRSFTILKYKSKKNSNKLIYDGLLIDVNKTSVKNTWSSPSYYTEDELFDILLEEARMYIKNELLENEYIIKENTLKKSIDSDKMYLEVFFKVYKNIALEEDLKIDTEGE